MKKHWIGLTIKNTDKFCRKEATHYILYIYKIYIVWYTNVGGKLSEETEINRGGRQGYSLSPNLHNTYILATFLGSGNPRII